MTLLDRVVATLTADGVGHALIGAAALAARGVARSTYDIDLLTTVPAVLDSTRWDGLRSAGVTVDVRRGDVDDPLAGVVRLEAAGERPVDLVVGRFAWQARAVERAERVPGGPPVVRAVDLVLLKLYAGGTQDLWDVRALLAAVDDSALAAEVEEALAGLPGVLDARWAAVRAEGRPGRR